MMYLNSNKIWVIKDGKTSEFRGFIKDYLEERKEILKAGVLSWVNADRSKTIYNQRDMELKELEFIEDFLQIPDYLLTRISNSTDISVEGDH